MKKLGPIISNNTSYRNINCEKYSQCLKVTVALEWNSFSCNGCSQKIDTKLLWKAYSKTKKDSLLKAICKPESFRKEIITTSSL